MAELFKKYVLRDLTSEEVHARLKRWRPVNRYRRTKGGKFESDEGGELFYVVPCKDAFNTAYLWDAKPETPVPAEYREVARFVSIHTFGAPSFFKPSLAECVAQIPARFHDRDIAFETRTPEGSLWGTYLADDGRLWDNLNEWSNATGRDVYEFGGTESVHRAEMRIYARDRRPDDETVVYGARVYPAVSIEDFLNDVKRHDALAALHASIVLEAQHVPTRGDVYSHHVKGTAEQLAQIAGLDTVKAMILDLPEKPSWL